MKLFIPVLLSAALFSYGIQELAYDKDLVDSPSFSDDTPVKMRNRSEIKTLGQLKQKDLSKWVHSDKNWWKNPLNEIISSLFDDPKEVIVSRVAAMDFLLQAGISPQFFFGGLYRYEFPYFYSAAEIPYIYALLLKHGLNAGDPFPTGFYALEDVERIPTSIVKQLVERGAPVNDANGSNQTPLFSITGYLKYFPEEEVVENVYGNLKFLLEHGADANVVDKYGYRAIDYIYMRHPAAKRFEQLLLKHGSMAKQTSDDFGPYVEM